jgi:hypothetical protein
VVSAPSLEVRTSPLITMEVVGREPAGLDADGSERKGLRPPESARRVEGGGHQGATVRTFAFVHLRVLVVTAREGLQRE